MLYTKKTKAMINNYNLDYYINLFIDFENTDEEITDANKAKYKYSDLSINPYSTLFVDEDDYIGLDVTFEQDYAALKELIISLEADGIKYKIMDSNECQIKSFDEIMEYIERYKSTIQEYD